MVWRVGVKGTITNSSRNYGGKGLVRDNSMGDNLDIVPACATINYGYKI